MGTETSQVVRSDVDVIRKRPGMYIGDTGRYGLAHVVFFAIDVACSSSSTPATRLQVKLRKDGAVVVRSDAGTSRAAELISVLEQGSFESTLAADDDAPWELLVLAALASEFRLTLRTREAGLSWNGRRGIRRGKLRDIGGGPARVEIVFAPDPELFEGRSISFEAVVTRLQEIAPLSAGLHVRGVDEASGAEFATSYPEGLATLVSWSAGLRPRIQKPVLVDETWNALRVRAALQWAYPNEYARSVISYVNTVRTRGGGSHERGLMRAVEATSVPGFDRTTDGLIAAIAIDGPRRSLRFQGPTKDVLSVDGLEEAVFVRVRNAITESFASA